MAIKNIALGGASDFNEAKYISTTFTEDLNDTFDAAATKIKTLSTFWLNSYLKTEVGDPNDYTNGTVSGTTDGTGNFPFISTTSQGGNRVVQLFQNTDWSIQLNYDTGNAAARQPKMIIAGTSPNKTMTLYSYDDAGTDVYSSATATTRTLEANKHTHATGYFSGSATYGYSSTYKEIYFGGQLLRRQTQTNGETYSETNYFDVTVIAKGSDVYDVYYCDTKVLSDETLTGSPQLQFLARCLLNPGSNTESSLLTIKSVTQAQEETQ